MSLIDIVVEPYGPLWRVMEKRGPAFSYVLASHNDEESAESHARRIRAALDWRPGGGDPWAAHVAAQDERIGRLEAELREVRERAVTLGEPLRFTGPTTALDEVDV